MKGTLQVRLQQVPHRLRVEQTCRPNVETRRICDTIPPETKAPHNPGRAATNCFSKADICHSHNLWFNRYLIDLLR